MAVTNPKGELNPPISEMKAEEERKIPVFTVLKNDSILKNIFLLDKPPSIVPSSSSSMDFSSKFGKESISEETLLIGRHPDCNIILEHPSISRFHLRIHFNPSSSSLSVIDLYSVHGTWISGRKIKPGVLVELKVGDTLQLGGSRRLYKLHWLPLSRAYDLDNSFVPPLDASDAVEKTGRIYRCSQDENQLLAENEESDLVQKTDDNLECLMLLSFAHKVSLLAPPMSEDVDDSFLGKEKIENMNSLGIIHEESVESTPEDASFSSRVSHTVSRLENPELSQVNLGKTGSSIWSRRGKLGSVHIQIHTNREKRSASNTNSEPKSPVREYVQIESDSQELFTSGSKERICDADKENCSPDSPLLQSLDKTICSDVDCNKEEILTPGDSQVQSPIRLYPRTESTSKEPFANVKPDEIQNFTACKKSSSLNQSPLLQSLGSMGGKNSKGEFISTTLSSCAARDEEISTPDNTEVKSHIHECSQTETVSEDAFASAESFEKTSSYQSSRTLNFSCINQDDEIFTPENSHVRAPIRGYSQTDSDGKHGLTPNKENCCPSTRLKSLENEVQENSRSELTSQTLFSHVDDDEEEIYTPDKENVTPNTLGQRSMMNSQTPISCVDEDEEEIYTPDKENMTPSTLLLRVTHKSQTPNSCVDDEEEIYTPDKENITPDTLRLRPMETVGKLKEVKFSNSYRSSPLKKVVSCNKAQKEEIPASLEKEKQILPLLQNRKSVNSALKIDAGSEQKLAVWRATADRKPLQSLLMNSTAKSKKSSKASDSCGTTRSGKSINIQLEEIFQPLNTKNTKEEDKRWIMVVDVASLLNERSRKELQLMQGLKGTSLIVPRIVVRELDCMLRRGNFFRRTTEVSAALHWIEDCLKNFEGWIHVQSLAQEQRPIAPTPPYSPLSWFCEENGAFLSPFSSCSLQDIVTPTTEDHVLECALYFKRIRNDKQLVLLSNDVALKIKAMSEGVNCETAEEFRDSLVNPFSDRFLYRDSSPRGPTWTCVDDIVLKEKYYPGRPLKKQSRSGEAVKGLKLILLHNSNFRRTSSVS